MQEIADALDYKTPSAVKKRIDRIAEQYEAFANPINDDGERIKSTKKKTEKIFEARKKRPFSCQCIVKGSS